MERRTPAIGCVAAALFGALLHATSIIGCNQCPSGASRCAGSGTMEICAGGGDVPLSGSNSWNPQSCGPRNPFCAVLSSGATCVATPSPVPECDDGGSQGGWLCSAGQEGETLAGRCNEGYVSASDVCFGPNTFCVVTASSGAFCAMDAGLDVGDAAPPAVDAAIDARLDADADAVDATVAGPGVADAGGASAD